MREPGMSRQIGAKSLINTQIVKLTSFLQKAFPLALCVGAMLFFLCLPASAEDALLARDSVGTSMVRPIDRTSLKAGGDACAPGQALLTQVVRAELSAGETPASPVVQHNSVAYFSMYKIKIHNFAAWCIVVDFSFGE